MASKRHARKDLEGFQDGRDENNLAEFPLSLLTDAAPEGQKTLEFNDTVTDWQTGQLVTRCVCITGSDKFGLPTPKDEDVLLALIQLTKISNNFSSPEVHFTKRLVLDLLGWENRGWAYDRLEESLHRWKGVSIHYKSAWRDNARGKWCDSEAVGVIEYVKLTDSRRKSGEGEVDSYSRIVWNKVLFDSFASGYLKRLDYQAYRSLERPAARRAYRFLDKRFHHRPDWEFELRAFACEKIGLSRAYDTGQLKERLRPALCELERMGFIAPVTYRKERPKVWKIAITKSSGKENREAATASSPLIDELVNRGLDASAARGLAKEYSEELIREKLQFFDWLVSRGDKRVSKNPPGFLAAAIRKDYAAPRDFNRTRRDAANRLNRNSAKRSLEQSPASNDPVTEKQLERIKQARELFAGLSPEAQNDLEARVLATGNRLHAEIYARRKATGGTLFEEMRDALIAAALESGQVQK